MAKRKFSNRSLQLDQLQNIIAYSVTKYGCKKNAGFPENIEGLIELRYVINLFIHYLPEMTFKKCKQQCY